MPGLGVVLLSALLEPELPCSKQPLRAVAHVARHIALKIGEVMVGTRVLLLLSDAAELPSLTLWIDFFSHLHGIVP